MSACCWDSVEFKPIIQTIVFVNWLHCLPVFVLCYIFNERGLLEAQKFKRHSALLPTDFLLHFVMELFKWIKNVRGYYDGKWSSIQFANMDNSYWLVWSSSRREGIWVKRVDGQNIVKLSTFLIKFLSAPQILFQIYFACWLYLNPGKNNFFLFQSTENNDNLTDNQPRRHPPTHTHTTQETTTHPHTHTYTHKHTSKIHTVTLQ